MAFEIQNFLSSFENQNMTSHSDKFDVIIIPPSSMAVTGMDLQSHYTCENAELPGVDITPLEYRHHAFIRRVPFHLNYAPITLTFYCTGNMIEKKYFDFWMNQCVDHQTGLVQYRLDGSGNPQYETTIYLNQYAVNGAPAYFAKIEEAFPISMTPINLNWSDDSIERLAITFAFTRWFTYQDGDQGFFTASPASTGPLFVNLGAEVNALAQGIQTALKSGNPIQVFQGINEAVAAGTDISNQVNNFTNQLSNF